MVNGEIRVYASSQLVHTLIEHDLVDELRLAIFPLVMGAGNSETLRTRPNEWRRWGCTRVGGRIPTGCPCNAGSRQDRREPDVQPDVQPDVLPGCLLLAGGLVKLVYSFAVTAEQPGIRTLRRPAGRGAGCSPGTVLITIFRARSA